MRSVSGTVWRFISWPFRWALTKVGNAISEFLQRMGERLSDGAGSALRAAAGASVILGVAIIGTMLFIGLPDVDLALLPILHHRSILTHSLLPALPLLWLKTRIGRAFGIGGCIGIAVHLSADLLSPMIGFAQIWLPAPIKTPLGPLSYVWLLANAVGGIVLALRIARRGKSPSLASGLTVVYACVPAVLYGALNEGSWVASFTAIGIIAAGAAVGLRALKRDP